MGKYDPVDPNHRPQDMPGFDKMIGREDNEVDKDDD